MTIALIDGDLVAYRCAAVNENSNEGLACWQTDQLISRILEDTNADNWQIFLSGENNFRYNIDPNYKANRRDQPRPRFLEPVREYLVREHGASIADGYEADDSIGIALTRFSSDRCVVCSLDKDLLQLPGTHYNFVRGDFINITEIGGLRNFYEQLLVGDSSDNIRGCPGIGKAKAPRLLEGCESESCFLDCCWAAFAKAGATESEFIRDAKLLYILRSEDDWWSKTLQLDLVLK